MEEEELDDDEEEEDPDEDEDKDNGKAPRTFDQGQMVLTCHDNANTMVDNQPTVRLEQDQEICEHSSMPQRPVPATQPHTLEPRPQQ